MTSDVFHPTVQDRTEQVEKFYWHSVFPSFVRMLRSPRTGGGLVAGNFGRRPSTRISRRLSYYDPLFFRLPGFFSGSCFVVPSSDVSSAKVFSASRFVRSTSRSKSLLGWLASNARRCSSNLSNSLWALAAPDSWGIVPLCWRPSRSFNRAKACSFSLPSPLCIPLFFLASTS